MTKKFPAPCSIPGTGARRAPSCVTVFVLPGTETVRNFCRFVRNRPM